MALSLKAESSWKFCKFYFYKKFHKKSFHHIASVLCLRRFDEINNIRLVFNIPKMDLLMTRSPLITLGPGRAISVLPILPDIISIRSELTPVLTKTWCPPVAGQTDREEDLFPYSWYDLSIWYRPGRVLLSLILFSPLRNKSCWKVWAEDLLLLHDCGEM